MEKTEQLRALTVEYFGADQRRIQHFLKVFDYAKKICEKEKMNDLQPIVEAASIVHDVGIKNSEIKYNSSAGKYQELEGPPVAKDLLEKCGYDGEFISRVCFLVGHHHTYQAIDGLDFQILVEADFLVNVVEDKMSLDAISEIKKRIFATEAGLELLDSLMMGVDG